MKLGVNTYGAGDILYKNTQDGLKKLKHIGYTSVEPCVVFHRGISRFSWFFLKIGLTVAGQFKRNMTVNTALAFIATAKREGMQVVGAHATFASLTKNFLIKAIPQATAFVRSSGVRFLVVSLMLKNIAQAKKYLPALGEFVSAMDKIGVRVLYHNHEYEFNAEDGTTVLKYLMNSIPTLGLEIDVGWAKFANQDFYDLAREYGDRVKLVHLKDIRSNFCEKNRNRCFTAVGEGCIPLKEILSLSRKIGVGEDGFIVDQDDSQGEMLNDLAIGYTNVLQAYKSVFSSESNIREESLFSSNA